MGYAFTMSPCARCRKVFSYNPLRVPSIRINNVREPICQECIRWINRERAKRGLQAVILHKDAYEPIDEMELP